MIITGGHYVSNVTRYNKEGYVETLPNMLMDRFDHGCACFFHQGKKVRK